MADDDQVADELAAIAERARADQAEAADGDAGGERDSLGRRKGGRPVGSSPGTCVVCAGPGVADPDRFPARTPTSFYCDEHVPLRKDRKPRVRKRAPATDGGGGGGAVAKLEADLRDQLTMLAQVLTPIDPMCAPVLQAQAPLIAAFWAERAKSSDRVKALLTNVAGGGGLVGGLLAHGPLLMVLVGHHIIEPRRRAMMPPEGTVEVGEDGQRYQVQQGQWVPVAGPGDNAGHGPQTATG